MTPRWGEGDNRRVPPIGTGGFVSWTTSSIRCCESCGARFPTRSPNRRTSTARCARSAKRATRSTCWWTASATSTIPTPLALTAPRRPTSGEPAFQIDARDLIFLQLDRHRPHAAPAPPQSQRRLTFPGCTPLPSRSNHDFDRPANRAGFHGRRRRSTHRPSRPVARAPGRGARAGRRPSVPRQADLPGALRAGGARLLRDHRPAAGSCAPAWPSATASACPRSPRGTSRRTAPASTSSGCATAPPSRRWTSPTGGRRTFCISSQAGCALACAFCVTGYWGAGRNLTAGEIVGQVLAIRADRGLPPGGAEPRLHGHGRAAAQPGERQGRARHPDRVDLRRTASPSPPWASCPASRRWRRGSGGRTWRSRSTRRTRSGAARSCRSTAPSRWPS